MCIHTCMYTYTRNMTYTHHRARCQGRLASFPDKAIRCHQLFLSAQARACSLYIYIYIYIYTCEVFPCFVQDDQVLYTYIYIYTHIKCMYVYMYACIVCIHTHFYISFLFAIYRYHIC